MLLLAECETGRNLEIQRGFSLSLQQNKIISVVTVGNLCIFCTWLCIFLFFGISTQNWPWSVVRDVICSLRSLCQPIPKNPRPLQPLQELTSTHFRYSCPKCRFLMLTNQTTYSFGNVKKMETWYPFFIIFAVVPIHTKAAIVFSKS